MMSQAHGSKNYKPRRNYQVVLTDQTTAKAEKTRWNNSKRSTTSKRRKGRHRDTGRTTIRDKEKSKRTIQTIRRRNVFLEKIRYYRTQRYPDSQIMNLLDNMPRRTYYNYVKKLQEQERQITEQWMSEHVEHYAEELMIYRETLCQKLRDIQAIIDNKNTPPKEKMQAITQCLAITEKLVKFEEAAG